MVQILVIEDQQSLRQEIIELLDLEGYQTLEAENGRIGLDLAQRKQPNLILCDIAMPELNGHQVLSGLRQDPLTATIPLIFLTAKVDKVDMRQGMQLGADDYLTKPFTRAELLGAIAAQLRKQEAIIRKTQHTLDQLRNSITSALPHELHTPLSIIISASDLLLEDYGKVPAAEVREMLEMIRTSAEQLYGLTQNFLLQAELDLIATDAEQIAAMRTKRTSNVALTITETALASARKANRKDDLQIEVQDATVAIAEQHLQKIVHEVIDNAFKFSATGSPVTVTTQLDVTQVYLTIGDRGRGMTPDQIAHVGAYMQFERRLYEQQGSGLGLSVVKRLAELYGGTFAICSTPNQQTTVTIGLPRLA